MLKLGWDLVFTIINLIVLYLLLKKFLIGPVTGIMEKRKALIESSLEDAAAQKNQAQEMKQQYEQSLAASRLESDEIVARARIDARAEYEQILKDAGVQAGQIIENARKSVEAEREQALREMKAQIASLAMDAAEKVTAGKAGAELDQALFDQFITETGDGK